ncbi:hypothetical protein DSO57_1002952 [Entomophthora muscae]|uniref:Uncharacterized protein n=1 Tax=Entomophthora muscae TaxID=34485 RepID=A0ACC2T8J7_9FUNG|nr:hypothetical protein DSO57_1002952 [Entomophthora muscae]
MVGGLNPPAGFCSRPHICLAARCEGSKPVPVIPRRSSQRVAVNSQHPCPRSNKNTKQPKSQASKNSKIPATTIKHTKKPDKAKTPLSPKTIPPPP